MQTYSHNDPKIQPDCQDAWEQRNSNQTKNSHSESEMQKHPLLRNQKYGSQVAAASKIIELLYVSSTNNGDESFPEASKQLSICHHKRSDFPDMSHQTSRNVHPTKAKCIHCQHCSSRKHQSDKNASIPRAKKEGPGRPCQTHLQSILKKNETTLEDFLEGASARKY